MSQLGTPISAPLNFMPGGNPVGGAGGTPAQNYALSYESALQTNQANYNNIIGGYKTVLNNVGNTLGQGGTPWGVAGPAAQSIADVYAQQKGGAIQNSINSGLGQTTAATAAQRGAGYDAQKAYAGLGANLAQTYAGYEANLGQGELNFLNSVQAPYPNAGDYNQLYGNQLGYAQAQADRQRAQSFGLLGNLMGGGESGGIIGAGSSSLPKVNTGGGQRGFPASPIGNSSPYMFGIGAGSGLYSGAGGVGASGSINPYGTPIGSTNQDPSLDPNLGGSIDQFAPYVPPSEDTGGGDSGSFGSDY